VNRTVGRLVLGASSAGPALCELAIRRWGRRGASFVAVVCTGLAGRDLALVAAGVPGRLRRVPGTLLYLELVAAGAGAVLTWRRAASSETPEPGEAAPDSLEMARRVTVAALFGLHTVRFRIYLRPDQGRRAGVPD
jgi:hypothetical protein